MEGDPVSDVYQRVKVINHNPFTIRDRHDGLPYIFIRDVEVIVPPDVALHLFAFPGEEADMHAHMARRWGWNRKEHCEVDEETGLMKWQSMCRNVEISVEHYEMRKVRQPDEPIPAEEADEAPDMYPEIRRDDRDDVPTRTLIGRKRTVKSLGRSKLRRHVVSAAPRAPNVEIPADDLVMVKEAPDAASETG